MKKSILLSLIITAFLSVFFTTLTYAAYVRGYIKKNGTVVQPYQRTNPDSNPYNNYSFPGNYNPNTGKTTPGNANTYINNYYKNKSYSPSLYYMCPLFSTYNSSTNSCDCYYNYMPSTDFLGNPSCISKNQFCSNKFGYGADYNSLTNSCECMYGYRASTDSLGNQQCVSGYTYCSDKFGFGATYNYLSGGCECMYGYTVGYDYLGNQVCKLNY